MMILHTIVLKSQYLQIDNSFSSKNPMRAHIFLKIKLNFIILDSSTYES